LVSLYMCKWLLEPFSLSLLRITLKKSLKILI
jgi:hypothetical protein